ncbi:hypothetical protein TNCV_4122751 [Trichonephila clavipes]|nr:hypothetical protein TNCV_4122751 [Trichonephila clavipes]
MKLQGMKWRSPASSRRKNVSRKIMHQNDVHRLFYSQGVTHNDFRPEGTTMNAARCNVISTRFMKRLQYTQHGSWGVQCIHDNTRPHTTNIGMVKCKHPPSRQTLQAFSYSQDSNRFEKKEI